MAVSATTVKAVLLKDFDPSLADSVLDSPIAEAALMVADLVAYGAANGVTVSSARQEVIQNNLAAWSYSMSDRPFKQKATASKSGTFDGQSSTGLRANLYGQKAIALDPTGYLSNLDTPRRKIGMAWLGKSRSEQVAYEDRN